MTHPDHASGITFPWAGLAVGGTYLYTRPGWGQPHAVTIERRDTDPGPRVRFDPTEPLPTLLQHVPHDAVFLPPAR